jgi:hypothetical protein
VRVYSMSSAVRLACCCALMIGVGSVALASVPESSTAPVNVGGSRVPSSFELAVNGFHTAAEPREKFSLGFRHEGPFTASAPFCSPGYAVDLEQLAGTALREFTCGDGSGRITARKSLLRADSQFTHEEGVWAIVDGSGRYSTLRGKGTYVSDVVSGDAANHITTRFREIWRGVIDFDDTPPDVRISRATAKRLPRRKGTYSVRVAFVARDASIVSYAMTISGSGVYVRRSGTTSSGTVSRAFRVRPDKPVRRLLLVVRASDAVGNETRVARSLRVPT